MVLIPIPDHTEQLANARRAAQLHVAKVIDQASLNPQTLTSAIEDILRSQSFKRNSVEISSRARAMKGVPLACDMIEKLMERNYN
jgi:UDP:flavonoid glycosyltransferase YjiC (YdhE family)